ncbi:isochorismate synthase [Haloarchaeobius sp. DYHT-AS-18]|uniref:isochorismate synthase n=1 Tax=Haloarchaeobius sp. DYHT-AS-18 TaxID=3446117 RepID=UPI003EC0815E
MERARSEGTVTAPAVGTDGVLVSRSRPIDDVSYRAFLASRKPPRLHWANFEGLELAGAGAAARLTASGPDRFASIRASAETLFDDADCTNTDAPRPRLVGGFAFSDDHEPTDTWAGFGAAEFLLPEVQLTRTEDGTWLTVNRYGKHVDPASVEAQLDRAADAVTDLPAMRPRGGSPGVLSTRRTTPKEVWTEQVEDAVGRIRAGDLRKVVLGCALEVGLAGEVDLPDVLERLRRTYPNCYRFLVQPTDEAGFLGAPPERLVKKSGRRVLTEALAGSVGRGGTPEADETLAQSLVDSEKIQHEQRLVVDTICEQLAPLGDVTEGEQTVRKLNNIQHLQTLITADLDTDGHVLDIVEALHPTPAVGGLPPETAAETIRDVETFDRGWYAAPIGWFDGDGDGEFLVGIRSGVAGGRNATLFAGNGIVADSDPQEEWDEIQLKYRPLLDELE